MLKDDPSDIRFPSLFTNKVTTSWKRPRGVVVVVISSTCLQYVIMHARGACRRTLFMVTWRINSFSGLRRSHDQFPLNSTALLLSCRICHVENEWERGHGQREVGDARVLRDFSGCFRSRMLYTHNVYIFVELRQTSGKVNVQIIF